MKVILLLLATSITTLIWLLKYQWYFDFWVIEFISRVDMSWIKSTLDYIYYIPDTMFQNNWENIKIFLSKYIELQEQENYLFIVFVFHFILYTMAYYLIKIIWGYNSKKITLFFISLFYLSLIYILKLLT